MEIVSVNLGERKEVTWNGKKIVTGIFKFPISKAVYLNSEDVDGDAVVDRKHHGGIDQAVYGYASEHYNYWKPLYEELNWDYGMFGENLTITGLDETKIHVGNQYTVGEVILEVTKPRQPCMKLGVRFGTQKILKEFWNSTMSGIYFKVIQKGHVKTGDSLVLIHEAKKNPTIAEVYQKIST